MNLAHIIDAHAADAVAIISRGRPTTYGVLRDQVARVRGGLAQRGLQQGDRLALLCNNGRYFVDLYLAGLGLGVVVVPLNPGSPAREIEQQLATVGAAAVAVDPFAAPAWSQVDRNRLPGLHTVIATEPAGPSSGPTRSTVGDLVFDDLLASEPVATVELADDALAALIFTSGTAGAPRAAMLSHGNLFANIEQARSADGVQPDDVIYGVLPLFHIYGLNTVLGIGLARGATVVMVQRFDPSTALDTIRERGVTMIPGAPPLWLAFSHFDEAPADGFAGVRLAISGAARMPEEATKRLRERFGLELHEGYGLTEAAPLVTTSAGLPAKVGSVGKALAGVEVRLVDERGDDVPLGDSGEIWVRGANVFQGYWQEPEVTAKVLTPEGWLRTGDIGVADADGYLYLVDRAKDLIIVSGFNVFPAEVEEVLLEHPDVVEAGVVGVPHPHHGEAVKAFVVLRPGASAHEDTLVAWCSEHLARYKCPSKILFVDELPRNISGKLVRRSLVET